ncbi:MAG: molybdopterin molybdotransferase MoeA [Thermoplasmata archaeon]|nr:molybdopterin molybdotransferase MoeA [Thermoplasmata archaeon]
MGFHPFGRLRPIPEVERLLARQARPVRRREAIPLEEALGRVSARTVTAPRPVPSFRRASWDGFAVRARDTTRSGAKRPVWLTVVGEQFAETSRRSPLCAGEAVEIATGSALPRGADSVAIYEDVRSVGGRLQISRPVARGARVADIGEDFARGARLVRAGEPLDAAGLGALAAIGRSTVEVYARPRVLIIPNGNELRLAGASLGAGQIYEANHVSLASFCSAAGAQVSWIPPVPDDPKAIEAAIRRGLPQCDLVLVTGGSSVGERDYLPRVFPRIGRLLFHGIAVRPGKPTLAAVANGRLVMGLPGHPTSCLANAYWLLLPILRRLAGLPGTGLTECSVRMAEAYPVSGPGFTTVVPLRIAGGLGHPTFKDSSAITSLSGANGFLLRPGTAGPIRRGERVVASLLPHPIGQPPVPPAGRPQGYRNRGR